MLKGRHKPWDYLLTTKSWELAPPWRWLLDVYSASRGPASRTAPWETPRLPSREPDTDKPAIYFGCIRSKPLTPWTQRSWNRFRISWQRTSPSWRKNTKPSWIFRVVIYWGRKSVSGQCRLNRDPRTMRLQVVPPSGLSSSFVRPI